MNKDQKALVVQSLKDAFSNSEASFLVKYQGLTVEKMQQLRREVLAKGGFFKVAKARLMKRAVDGVSGADAIKPFLKDQIGIVFAKNQSPAVAKIVYDFSKKNEQLKLIMGYFEQEILTAEDVVKVAKLPGREILLAQLCGALKGSISKLAYVLHEIAQKKAA